LTVQYWEGTPTFSSGQVISAAGHLNALRRAIQYLFGLYQAPVMPFSGAYRTGVGSRWDGYIRHKTNTFRYSLRFSAAAGHSSTVTITYGGNTIFSQTLNDGAEQTFGGTVDLSSLGLTVGQFYAVAVELTGTQGLPPNWPYLQVNYLGEVYTPSYPTLAAFNDGDTPSASEWQALSDYAEELYMVLSHPRAPFWDTWSKIAYPYNGNAWIGFLHRHDYVLAQMRLRKRYKAHGSEAGVKYDFYLNGTTTSIYTIEAGNPPPFVNRTPENRNDFEHQDQYMPYLVQIDMSGRGLSVGDLYTLYIQLDQGEDPMEKLGKGVIDFAYEVPDVTAAPSGWIDLPEWQHGDYVYGSSTTKRIQDIKADLEWLGARATYENLAVKSAVAPRGYRFVRLHRWLHYLPEGDDEPQLGFYRDRWREVSLPSEGGSTWMAYDLDSAEGLFPGTRYRLIGATCALEDTDA